VNAVTPAVQQFALAGAAFLLLGSFLAATIVSLCGNRLSRWEPRARHRVILLLAMLPSMVALVLLLAVSLPSITALADPGLDHCVVHDDGHAHLCFIHGAAADVPAALGLAGALLVGFLVFSLGRGAAHLARARHLVSTLAATGVRDAELGVTVLESERPVCVTAGLWRPQILISRGLLASLSDGEREIILAHEQAHLKRRDALVAYGVRSLTALHLPGTRRWLARELELAAEQVCDDEAASLAKDRLAVAATILKVERIADHGTRSPLDCLAVAFGARAVARRVEALLSQPAHPRSLRWIWLSVGIATASALASAEEVHHLTESALSSVAP